MADGGITITGLDEVNKLFDRIRLGVSDKGPLLRVLNARAREQVARTFNLQADPITGAAWQPTSPFTLSLRPSGGGKTLRAGTGGLMDSIVRGNQDIEADRLTIGTNKIYGPIHQRGGIIKAKTGRFLAIPVTREAARFASGRQHWVRQWFSANPNGRWIHGSKGAAGFGTIGANGQRKFAGVLKPSVRIPQRRYLGIGPAYGKELFEDVLKYFVMLARKGTP